MIRNVVTFNATQYVQPTVHIPLIQRTGLADVKGVATAGTAASVDKGAILDESIAETSGTTTPRFLSGYGYHMSKAATMIALNNDNFAGGEYSSAFCSLAVAADPYGTAGKGGRVTRSGNDSGYGFYAAYANNAGGTWDALSLWSKDNVNFTARGTKHGAGGSTLLANGALTVLYDSGSNQYDTRWRIILGCVGTAGAGTGNAQWAQKYTGATSCLLDGDTQDYAYPCLWNTGLTAAVGFAPLPIRNNTGVNVSKPAECASFAADLLPTVAQLNADWSIAFVVMQGGLVAGTDSHLLTAAGANAFKIYTSDAHKLIVNIGAVSLTAATALALGEKHRVLITYKAATQTLSLYLDGALDASTNVAVLGVTGAITAAYLGRASAGATNIWNGFAQDLKVWKTTCLTSWAQAYSR